MLYFFIYKNCFNKNIEDLLNSAKRIESGCTTSRTVTFEKPFSKTPIVVLTVNATYKKTIIFTLLKSVSTTQFEYTVNWYNGNYGDATEPVHWIAIGE